MFAEKYPIVYPRLILGYFRIYALLSIKFDNLKEPTNMNVKKLTSGQLRPQKIIFQACCIIFSCDFSPPY